MDTDASVARLNVYAIPEQAVHSDKIGPPNTVQLRFQNGDDIGPLLGGRSRATGIELRELGT